MTTFSTEKLLRAMAEHRNEPYRMQLQSVGSVPAIFVSELEVGDHLVWNFGSSTTVEKIERASAKFANVTERSDKDGKVWVRRMMFTRLVAAARPDERGRLTFRVINRGSVGE